jgi:pyridoxal phosphate enzyme (YggS family)
VTSRHDDEGRRAELVSALGAVRARIAAACESVGRDARTVTMIAVTKTFPASDVAALASLGVTDIGENKDQEARAKIRELAEDGFEPSAVRWHLVGRLQSNKARSVAGYAHAVHSVDRAKLVPALADAVAARDRQPLEVFVQVSLDGDPNRGGALPGEVADLAAAVAGRRELVLRGVMAVPPLGSDARREFARLADVSRTLRESHPAADAISAGMSDDLEAAVEFGSTHVRVGTALLGRRGQVFS